MQCQAEAEEEHWNAMVKQQLSQSIVHALSAEELQDHGAVRLRQVLAVRISLWASQLILSLLLELSLLELQILQGLNFV